ncbi:MAG: hypothetical protein HQL74_13490 [Magnetococcales bacterium]|nr:hypothetical protein [Magnetococcales bacterium]
MARTLKKAAIAAMIFPLWFAASGCGGGGGGGSSSSSSNSVSGAVIDGPVTGATVTVRDKSGTVVGTTTTGSDATYTIAIPTGTSFPLRVSISGGTDQVTGGTPAPMDSLVTDATQTTANVTPITSVVYNAVVGTAGSLDKVTSAMVTTTKASVVAKYGFGIDAENSSIDPLTTPVTANNVSSMVRSSEAMAETVRRAVGSDPTKMSQVFTIIGKDVAGVPQTTVLPTGFTATTVNAALAQVAQQKVTVGMEVAANSMAVTKPDGSQYSATDAKSQLAQAVNRMVPSVSVTTAASKMDQMPVSTNQLAQVTADINNATTILTSLGESTAPMTALASAAKNMQAGQPGQGKVDNSVLTAAATTVKTVASNIGNNQYAPTLISASAAMAGNSGQLTIAGVVLDGPVTASTITVTDNSDSTVVATATSGADGRYFLQVPKDAKFPLHVSSSGGTDQISGGTAATMDSYVLDANQRTANLTPITTVMYRAAVTSAGGLSKLTATTTATVKTNVVAKFGFGIDAQESTFDPVASPVTPSNVASVGRASEAMAETVRRAIGSTASIVAQSLKVIGEDMADGSLDGLNYSATLTNTIPTGFTASTLVTAVAQQKALVGMEAVNNTLKVTKADGTQLTTTDVQTKLGQALNTMVPSVTTTAGTSAMAALPVSANQKSQASTDLGNAINVQKALGLNTTTLTTLQTAATGLTAGAAGAGAVKTADMDKASTSASTVSTGLKQGNFSTTAIQSAAAAVAPTTSTNIITGSMSAGAMIDTKVKVTLKDKNGQSLTCPAVGSTFTCVLDNLKSPAAPYFIQVVGTAAGKEYTLHSVAHKAGPANVNPMTNLVVANTIGGDPATVFASLGSTAIADKVAKIDSADKLAAKVTAFKASILKSLQDQGYTGAQDDPFTATVTKGQGLDKVFDGLDISLTSGGGYQIVDKIKMKTAGKAKATILSGNVATLDASKATIDTTKMTSGSTDFNDPSVKKKLVKPLSIASKVAVADKKKKVTTPTTSAKRAAPARRAFRMASDVEMATLDPMSAFYTDEPDVSLNERSGEALKQVNNILCTFGQTRYDVELNLGPYTAQIDTNKCGGGKNDAKGGKKKVNKSSGAGAPNFETWVINSERASDDDPQTVKVWVSDDGKNGGGQTPTPSLVYGYAEITQGGSETNPFGVFNMDFKGIFLDSKGKPTGAEKMRGNLDVVDNGDGRVKVVYMNQYTNDSGTPVTDKVVMFRSGDGSGGNGSVSFNESVWDDASQSNVAKTANFSFAYNDDWFLRQSDDNQAQVCFARNSFVTDVTGYNLYHLSVAPTGSTKSWVPGDAVMLNTGFPISTTDSSGAVAQGWVGYYGTWFPEGVTITNGTSVNKEETVRSDTDGTVSVKQTPYTVFQAGGKLTRHTKVPLTLADIKNIPLQFTETNASDQSSSDYLVEWNGTGFVKKAKMNATSGFFEKVATESAIDLTTLPYGGIDFWSDGLGGAVRVKLANCVGSKKSQWDQVSALLAAGDATGAETKSDAINADTTPETWSCKAADSTVAAFFRDDVVQPGTDAFNAVPATLLCGEHCPDPTKLATVDTTNPFKKDREMAADQTATDITKNFHGYGFNKSTMLLRNNSEDVVSAVSNTNFPYGIQSGPLFENTAANLKALQCDGDSTLICPWQAWDRLDVFYTWETGPNDWNKLTALKDTAGSFVKFDAPLKLSYSHQWSADVTTKYGLMYNGPGDLQGIPSRCVGTDGSDSEVSCGPTSRQVPDFTIDDGAVVTDADGATYLVRGMVMDARMLKDDSGACTNSGLTIEKQNLPAEVTFLGTPDPIDPATRLGEKSSLTGLTATPAVIAGEVQAQ